MKITKRQLKRIIREEKKNLQEQSDDVYQGTLWTYALQLCHEKHAEISETTSGAPDYIAELVGESMDQLEEILCDYWVDLHDTFKDYPGDQDAMWEALRDPAEIIMQEAYQEFLINLG
tara:strand:+ start:655 stop:1008 length:354 start_codon:yes stop_codon:yes gene_type:complete